MNKIKIGLIQQICESNIDLNKYNLKLEIEKLAIKGAELIVLQELHDSIYFCQNEDVNNFDLAEKIPGPTTDYYSDIAKANNIVLITSLFEKRTAGLYHNTAVVFEKDGNIAGKYRKMHIPDDPGFYEKFYFTPGDQNFTPIETSVGKLGVMICWDQWYPEAARIMTLKGAEILIYPTAIGWNPQDSKKEKNRQIEAWKTIQKSHAIANGVHVIAVNRIGNENDPSNQTSGIDFWGNSFICGPQGEELFLADQEKKSAVIEIDKVSTESVRRWWPFLRDRRIDYYDEIKNRFIDDEF
jgi:N-carbamoylputrescine amidase